MYSLHCFTISPKLKYCKKKEHNLKGNDDYFTEVFLCYKIILQLVITDVYRYFEGCVKSRLSWYLRIYKTISFNSKIKGWLPVYKNSNLYFSSQLEDNVYLLPSLFVSGWLTLLRSRYTPQRDTFLATSDNINFPRNSFYEMKTRQLTKNTQRKKELSNSIT